MDVCVAVHEGDLALGSAHEVRQQAEGVKHPPGGEDPLGFLCLAFERAECPVEGARRSNRVVALCRTFVAVMSHLGRGGIDDPRGCPFVTSPRVTNVGVHRHGVN